MQMIDFTSEHIVLVGALLLFVAVIAGKAAYRFGAPALLLFLGVGMLFGLDFISFRSVDMTQFLGMTSLCIILFTGGMDTKFSQIRPVIGPGVVLATAGVVITALILGTFVWLVAPLVGVEIPFVAALLLAATMSSTDSASVFSILRSKKRGLRENLRPLLELESGSNDPMAYMLTILLVGMLSRASGDTGVGMSIVFFIVQMVVGALSGYLIGRLAVFTINGINLANKSLYSVLLLAFIFFAFAFTDLVRGNGYLAVYLAGLVVGNHRLTQKQPMTIFFDGFTWLMQIVMFLTLGLFVNSDELLQPEVLILGLLVGAFMILVARPFRSSRAWHLSAAFRSRRGSTFRGWGCAAPCPFSLRSIPWWPGSDMPTCFSTSCSSPPSFRYWCKAPPSAAWPICWDFPTRSASRLSASTCRRRSSRSSRR